MSGQTAFAVGAWFLLGLLAIVSTFGIGAFLNMLCKRWWVSIAIYAAFSVYLMIVAAGHMSLAEWILYVIGWSGSALAAWTVYGLKKRGYPLFS
jgi:hypothetical protein